MMIVTSSSRRSTAFLFILTTFLICLYQFYDSIPAPGLSLPRGGSSSHKYAFCTFFAPSATKPGTTLEDEDHYFTGVRMLIYQLLHDPETRTQSSIPVVVMVTGDVSKEYRDRLTNDGATVIEVSPLTFDWIKPGRERWMRLMDKLHVFELVQFDKVLMLDSDIVVVKRLDSLFEDSSTQLADNRGRADVIMPDEAPQPPQYLMAGNAEGGMRLNGGFILLRPSVDMYKHYLSVASIEGRFNGTSCEQDLWNYVHRPDGNLPWKQIPKHWATNRPTWQDYQKGTASIHEKYWKCSHDQRLRSVLLKSRFKMEGFFESHDQL